MSVIRIKMIHLCVLDLRDLPKAPPISAPLVGMFTLTIPQSDPNGLQASKTSKNIYQ